MMGISKSYVGRKMAKYLLVGPENVGFSASKMSSFWPLKLISFQVSNYNILATSLNSFVMKTWKRLIGYLLQQKSSAPRGLDRSDSEQIHPHGWHGLKIAPKTVNFSFSLGLRSCYLLILVLVMTYKWMCAHSGDRYWASKQAWMLLIDAISR